MPNISIDVSNKIAQQSGTPLIVCGNSDYVIDFTFDAEWDEFAAKTARFTYFSRRKNCWQYEDVLFEGDSVAAPVLSDITEVAVGVYAGAIHTTTPALIPCARSITDGDPVHDPPPLDVYNQLMAYLAGLQGGAAGVPKLLLAGAVGGVTGIPEIVEEE